MHEMSEKICKLEFKVKGLKSKDRELRNIIEVPKTAKEPKNICVTKSLNLKFTTILCVAEARKPV